MAGTTASNSQDVDIPDLIKVICGFRTERYQYERYVALLTFSMWLSAPNVPETLRLAATVSAARVILAIHRGEIEHSEPLRQAAINEVVEHAFTALDAAEVVAGPSQPQLFSDSVERARPCIDDARDIVRFMITCPSDLKPSIKKMLYFFEKKGFPNRIVVAESSLKNHWTLLATSAPFLLAGERTSFETIFNLPPDAGYSIRKAGEILQSVPQIREYFGRAAYIQNTSISHLKKMSLEKITFIELPDEIAPQVVEMVPFDERQYSIVKGYTVLSAQKKPKKE